MIASSVARSDRARTAHTAQPPSPIAAASRTSTRSRDGSPSGAGGRSRRPPPGHDRAMDRPTDRPGGRHDAVAGPFQQPAGDRRSVGAIQRVEDVALGQGDLRGARAIGGGVRLEELAGEALATMRGLDAEGQELLGLAIDPGDREPDDGRARRTAAVTRAPSASAGKDESRAPPAGSAGATTRGASDRPDQVAASTSATIVGVPLAGPPSLTCPRARARAGPTSPRSRPTCNEPRHEHAPDERRDPGRPLLDAACAASNRARHWARRRTARAAAPARTVPPRWPIARARPAASRPGPRDAPRPARSGPTSAAPPDRRRSHRHPSRASGPRAYRCASVSTSRAAAPMRGRRHVQVGERIPGVRVRAVLGHDAGRAPNVAASSGSSSGDGGPATPARPSRPAAGC